MGWLLGREDGLILLAGRMVADVIETRNVIPSLGFKTCMTIKS